jgi:prepilin-type N-terminal cleavage/methylation domain-containing protein
MRRGVTLVELVVTVVVFGLVSGLVTRGALFHQRLQRRMQSADEGTRAARQAIAILARAIRGAEPADLLPDRASDSAFEFMAPVGAGVACIDGAVLRAVSGASPGGLSLASFTAAPRAGDRVLVLDDRGGPPRWRARTIVAAQPTVRPCVAAGMRPGPGITLLLDSTLDVGAFAAFRIGRRTRFDLYRGGDRHWYLGMREWNPRSREFNGVQPVAGPLRAYSVREDSSGLHFAYRDSSGRRLGVPDSAAVVVSMVITARAADRTVHAQQRVLALRRAP